MGKKLTIGFIKESFECGGYRCLSNKYSGSRDKLDYICSKGHSGSISWTAWQQGNRCPTCFVVKNKHTIAFIKSEFEKGGYVCLSKEYVNTRSKVDYICPEGHRGSITWSNWQQGRRCPICAGVKKHTIEFIKSEFEKEGWVCVSTEYINAHSNLNYICSEGHHGSIAWSDWKKGNRCPVCSGKKKHTISFMKSEFKKDEYECLSTEYIGAHSKLDYICPKGHRGSIRWSHWQSGHRCPKCNNNGVSIWEGLVKKFVSKINKNFLENDRTQIINTDTNRYLELDLWFPDLNKAIECNGVYWHSGKRRKILDKIKREWCRNNNVTLLTITDNEWTDDIEKCQTKIKKFLN